MKNRKILLTCLLVGTLDALAAIIQFKANGGNNPVVIAKFIASAVFGSVAYRGGAEFVLSGILFHYCIASIWVVLYFFVYPKISRYLPNKYIAGVLYGIVIWLVMNLLVLPNSLIPPITRNLTQDVIGALILVVAVGLPVSIIQQGLAQRKNEGHTYVTENAK